MTRTAKADFGQIGFDEDFSGFDVDDDFAMPAAASNTPIDVSAWEEPDLTLAAPDVELPAVETSTMAVNPMGALLIGGEAALGEAAVPRISIHVFFQRSETEALAEQMKGDRRLARASTVIRGGSLDDALALYQNQPTPSLILVESTADAASLLAGLDRLAEVCDPGTKVVVIGTHNDIPLYRELMRRGVSEYLVPPMQTLQLIRAVTTLYSDPATPFIGRTLAFVGAKGGVGSSTLAHNIAYAMSEQTQASTVIVDYDLPFGTAGLDFNQDPLQGFADALSKPDRLDPVLLDRMTARCGERLSLFAAPASLDDDHDYSADTYEEVLGKIRATAPYVVLDLPHIWTGWMRRTLLAADDVVVVASPDLASLRNAKNLLDLVRKGRPNDHPPQLILNQVGVPGRPEIPVKDFAKALGLEPSLVLPFDAKLFGQAANNGQMIQDVNAKSKVSEGLAQFAQQLSRREAATAAPKTAKSLIERLRKRG
ncbi:CpaE family protein [Caulobacter sp. S45]|uniref:AAA family ATPase n=1 Tax=Caulobacter sp. S45 TaxID=1641861 RepID=UPI00131A999D|nr:AAA family ATPase [Caulobacter sp. S45]